MAKKTAQEILNDIDDRYPNIFTDEQKTRWLNIAITDLYKVLGEEDIMETLTVADQPFYFLADVDEDLLQIEFELIRAVTVNDVEYRPKNITDNREPNIYYKVADEYLGIYPTPKTAGQKIYIHYKKRPVEIVYTVLTVIPEVSEDHYEILKYGVMVIMAESLDDIIKRNNFSNEFNARLQDALQDRNDQFAAFPTCEDVMTRKNKSYNRRGRVVSEVISNGITI